MPKFIVLLQQYVENVAEVEVEAANEDDARDKVMMSDPGVSANWGPGDDAYDAECYCVLDSNRDVVWER